jgi:hypothetical protein
VKGSETICPQTSTYFFARKFVGESAQTALILPSAKRRFLKLFSVQQAALCGLFAKPFFARLKQPDTAGQVHQNSCR